MSEALIEVDDLSVSFRSEHGHLLRAVDDVTLRITEGEVGLWQDHHREVHRRTGRPDLGGGAL